MRELIVRRLAICILCSADGANAYKLTRGGIVASLLLCPACFEQHRLPESRAESDRQV